MGKNKQIIQNSVKLSIKLSSNKSLSYIHTKVFHTWELEEKINRIANTGKIYTVVTCIFLHFISHFTNTKTTAGLNLRLVGNS